MSRKEEGLKWPGGQGLESEALRPWTLICFFWFKFALISGSFWHEWGSEMARRTRPRIRGLSALDFNVFFLVLV